MNAPNTMGPTEQSTRKSRVPTLRGVDLHEPGVDVQCGAGVGERLIPKARGGRGFGAELTERPGELSTIEEF